MKKKLFLFAFTLLFVFSPTSFGFGQSKEPTKLLEQLKTIKGNERNKVLLKIVNYYNDPEPGKALSFANEILRNTPKGDTTIRFKAYVKAIYLYSYMNDFNHFTRLEKQFKVEYRTHPKKMIYGLYLIVCLQTRVFDDKNSAIENLNEGEKLARVYQKSKIGEFIISKSIIYRHLNKLKESELFLKKYESLPKHSKSKLSEHEYLFFKINLSVLDGNIDFASKNINKHSSFYTSDYYKSLGEGNNEYIPHVINNCKNYIYLNKLDTAKYYLDKAETLLLKNKIPFIKKEFFLASKKYYTAMNKLDDAKLYKDSIEIVNNEIIEYNRQQAENYYNQEMAFSHKLQKENLLRQTEQTSKYLWMFLAVLVICIGLVVTLLLYRRFITNKELALELTLVNEHMKQSIAEKNQVLTEKSLRLANQNDVLREVRTKLKSVKSKMNGSTPKELNDILGIVSTRASEQQWEEFQLYFYELYSDFYKNLINLHPDLTPNERRLCAFLKLNMSSKTISMITGQSLNSVEVARGRLRGKFNLKNSTTSFVEYFDQLENGVEIE